jgi:alpha-L-rhamnosidase
MDPLAATVLLCNGLRDPLGVDTPRPRLSWRCEDTGRLGARQTAYRLRAAWSDAALDASPCWDTGWVESGDCIQVPWQGPALAAAQAVSWQVMLRDEGGAAGPWSGIARWEMGLLEPGDWRAQWIGADTRVRANPSGEQPAPFLRREFTLPGPVVSARAWVCGLGWHELWINGRRVGNEELSPAFTRYDARALYVTHDVTAFLRTGANAVGAVLGTGWYDHTAGDVWDFKQAPWRDQPKVILRLRALLADGSTAEVVSGPGWTWRHGAILADALRNGEHYDARQELGGWSAPGLDPAGWKPVSLVPSPGGRLSSQQMPPIRVTETMAPAAVREPGPGVFVVDLGRIIAGRARIRVQGAAGSTVSLRYAERIKETGDIDPSGLDSMTKTGTFQSDTYVLKGTGTEEWEPRFAYHGFQYVQVKGWPGTPRVQDVDGRAVHTDLAPRGEFTCSEPLINAIHEIAKRSTLYNYHGFPTDCPQREKNGWTGDAHLSAEQALFNFDMDTAYRKWMTDLRDCQRASGQVPAVVPTGGWGFRFCSGPAWDSAALLIPWYLHVYRGDTAVLEEHYECMRRYVDFLGTMAEDFLVDFGLGDWCPPEWKPSVIWDPTYRCPTVVTDTAYYAVDARIVAASARALGRAGEAERYDALAARVRAAFRARFLDTTTGTVTGSCQASVACALYQGMVDQEEKPRVIERLVQTVEAADRHIDCGILGAKYIMHALTDAGRLDLAWAMATQTTYPGWGEWIARGATTMWETWNGDASRNHHMYSDVDAWFWRGLAGLAPDPEAPGFRHFTVTPGLAPGLTHVKARHLSPYGWIEVEWKRDAERFTLDLAVPPGCRATVRLPSVSTPPVKRDSGRHRFVETLRG